LTTGPSVSLLQGGRNAPLDVGEVERHLVHSATYVPAHTGADVENAIYFAELAGHRVLRFHNEILVAESRMDEGTNGLGSRNPYDRGWIATRLLELATREASSVDEHESGRLSYIGAWELLLANLLGHVSPEDQEALMGWVKAHNDEDCGRAVGWEGAAEEGHAEDARRQAMKVMRTLDSRAFAVTVREVAKLNQLRLEFWDDVVASMQAGERSGDYIIKITGSETPAWTVHANPGCN
jgi:hypothetical protein